MSANIITINRGDTFKFDLIVSDQNGEPYELHAQDTIYIGLMDPHQLFEDALVKKKFTSRDLNEDFTIPVVFEAKDTIDLYPGTYYYAVKLHKVDKSKGIDEVITIVNKTKFIIND